jgi:mRNA interferase MazF
MGGVKRGDLVTIAVQGDFGKPRPALVIQSDIFNEYHSTVTVLLISSKIIAAPIFRVLIEPNDKNGLKKTCQIQIDKAMTVRKEKIGPVIGQLIDVTMVAVTRALSIFLGFG